MGETTFFFYPSEFFGWFNNQINTKQINRGKQITYVGGGTINGYETQGHVRQLRLICLSELRNGVGPEGSKRRRVIHRTMRRPDGW